ncbi:MAG: FkbM family methyltransferase [Thermoproteota archaeon]
MMNMLRGFALTSKSMGLKVAFKEALRRAFSINYRYNNIPIKSSISFRVMRSMVLKGYDILESKGEVIVHTPFGDIGVDAADIDLLGVLEEPLDEMYMYVDVKDAVVIDIGAFIGETALLFLSKGARKVYAFEPLERHFGYLVRNLNRNNAVSRAVPLKYGAWHRETTVSVGYERTGTGLHASGDELVTLRMKHLSDILKTVYNREGVIDLVKMDCEGCEYSLLVLGEGELKLSRQYIVEVHGSEVPILDRMAECSYTVKPVLRLNQFVAVYLFTHR